MKYVRDAMEHRLPHLAALMPCLLIVVAMLGACNGARDHDPSMGEAKAVPQKATDAASVMVDHLSYRHDRSMEYTLLDLRSDPPAPVGGAIVDRLASGGEKNCCVSLPKTWRAGMRFRVTWEESDRERIYPEKYVKELEVPRYDTPADLYVVFLPQHEAELVVSAAEPGHEQWQGRIKQTPWDSCVQEVGRKACKRSIPNYGGLSPGELQGYCTYVREEKLDTSYCELAMKGCLQDFEDDQFCKSTLWGKRKELK